MTPRFKIRDKVTSVIHPAFLGQVVAITHYITGYVYIVTYFIGDEPLTTNMFEFEIELLSENGGIGFRKQEDGLQTTS